jgi:hypothetical protein
MRGAYQKIGMFYKCSMSHLFLIIYISDSLADHINLFEINDEDDSDHR